MPLRLYAISIVLFVTIFVISVTQSNFSDLISAERYYYFVIYYSVTVPFL